MLNSASLRNEIQDKIMFSKINNGISHIILSNFVSLYFRPNHSQVLQPNSGSDTISFRIHTGFLYLIVRNVYI